MKIAFLGLGKMGSAIVRHLHPANGDSWDHELVVWNRSPEAAEALAADGFKAVPTTAEAVAGCDVVFTMLADDAATEAVLSGAIDAMPPGAIHVALSTISVALSKRLAEQHRGHGQQFVAAPVFGRPNIAAEGRLWIVMAGDAASVERVQPLLLRASRGISVVSEEPWRANALKLGGNFMIANMLESLSEGFIYAESQGIDPSVFLDTVNAALFQSGFYAAYGKVILHPPEQPGMSVSLGAKDIRLLRDAATEAGVRLPLADFIAAQLQDAIGTGLKDADWPTAQFKMAQKAAHGS